MQLRLVYWNESYLQCIEGASTVELIKHLHFVVALMYASVYGECACWHCAVVASAIFNGLSMMNTISLKTLLLVMLVMYCTSFITPPLPLLIFCNSVSIHLALGLPIGCSAIVALTGLPKGYSAIVALTGLPKGYSVLVALTGLPIGYSVIVALTGLPIGHSVIVALTG